MQSIMQDGAPVLRKKAKPVPETLFGDEKLSRMIADMADALDAAIDGVALAGPQIGLPYRIFIVRKDRTLPPPPPSVTPYAPEIQVYINPEIVRASRKRQKADEGCLSVRGTYGTTSRPARVTVKAQREDGSSFTHAGTGLLAQIFEHEVDHLNGILFIDRTSTVVRLNDSSNNP